MGCFTSKIDQKTHAGNQNQVDGAATSFLAGETVGFCLNAPAGPMSLSGSTQRPQPLTVPCLLNRKKVFAVGINVCEARWREMGHVLLGSWWERGHADPSGLCLG